MAEYIIKNNYLSVTLSDVGGEPMSIKAADHEYLWQRDPKYWCSCAPLLFPTVGRLRDGVWMDGDTICSMACHGFARSKRMEAVAMRDFAEFTLKDDAETRAAYPYSFVLRRRFKLAKNSLLETVTVTNTNDREMPFGIGLHPGFILPEGRAQLSLETSGEVRRHLLSERFLMAGKDVAYPLREGKYIDLDNSLFDNDAIILSGIKSATLESKDDERSVTVVFPDAPFVGFWQPMHSDAPFLCIEPWKTLPASDAPEGSAPDRISERKGFVKLAPGASYNFNCMMIFN
ncbi:MAG: hypothetical protein ACI3XI_07380 [Eubacteriales bacterium]